MTKKKIKRGASFAKFKAMIALATGAPLGINSVPEWPVCLYTGYISEHVSLNVLEEKWSAVEAVLKTLRIKYTAMPDRSSVSGSPFYDVVLKREVFGKRTLAYLESL